MYMCAVDIEYVLKLHRDAIPPWLRQNIQRWYSVAMTLQTLPTVALLEIRPLNTALERKPRLPSHKPRPFTLSHAPLVKPRPLLKRPGNEKLLAPGHAPFR